MRQLILIAMMVAAAALAWSVDLVEVIDADTLIVRDGAEEWTAQVYGIDAPEIDEPFGEYARSLVLIAFARGATIQRAEFDPQQVDVTVAQGMLQVELVRLGLARATDGMHWRFLHAWESKPKELAMGIWSEAW